MFATCGLTAAKVMLCWGMDYQSLFGAAPGAVPTCPTTNAYPCTATPVTGPSGFVTLSSAEATQCGMRDDGIAYCWGANDFGQRGTPGTTPDPTPRVFSLSPTGKP
jgi:hypothetical protein